MKFLSAYGSLCALICSLLILSKCNDKLYHDPSGIGQQTVDGKKAEFEIYALMGQSNMAGRGEIDSIANTYISKDVLVLTENGSWKIAKHPLHFDKPSAAVGPGLKFGYELSKTTENKVALVPCAVGGTSISLWQLGMYDEITKTHPYDDAISRLEKALEYGGEIKGILWHQGERDRFSYSKENYLDELTALINRLRKFSGNPKLPFIAGEIGYFIDGSELFNQYLQDLPELVDYTAVVSAEGLTHKGDNLHFDSRSAELLGERFAKAMLSIQTQN